MSGETWSINFERGAIVGQDRTLIELAESIERSHVADFDGLKSVARCFAQLHDVEIYDESNSLLIESFGGPNEPWDISCSPGNFAQVSNSLEVSFLHRVKQERGK